MFETTVRVENVREVVSLLRKVDSESAKALQRDMKSAIKPIATRIIAGIPDFTPNVKGMAANKKGRARFSKPTATVSFTPGKYKMGSDTHPLVTIALNSRDSAYGFNYAETAGTKRIDPKPRSKPFIHWRSGAQVTYKYNNQGYWFIDVLERKYPIPGKSGRFAYGLFLNEYPAAERIAITILDAFTDELNKQLSEADNG